MDPPIRAALEALRDHIASLSGRRLIFVHLLYSDGTTDLLSVPPGPGPDSGAGPGSTSPEEEAAPSPALRERILEQLGQAQRPMKRSALARRCGVANAGHLRRTLEAMEDDGEVLRTPRGDYWLAGRPLPDEGQHSEE